MKRILTLLFLGSLFMQSQAQVLFSQDFESGVLDPMTAIDVDGKTVHPNVANSAGPTWSVRGTSPNSVIVSTSWFNPVGQADDWIISPAITIADANTFLTWQAWSPDAAFRDGYEVRISTTDNLIPSFTTLALTVPAENTTPTNRSLKLDAYIGQTIYFAFRNNSNDKFLLYMDNISVAVFKNRDLIVRGVTFEKYNPVSTQVPVKVTVENHGAEPLTSLIYTWTSGSNSYADTVSGLNVPLLATADLTHAINFDITEAGEFPVDISVSSPNGLDDEAPEDNYGVRMIYGLSEALPKKVVVEEGTGTWCGWCPRGFVALEQMAVDYPESALLISIHNYDPMTDAEYDAGLVGTISGFPSGHVDRKSVGIDPLDFIAALETLDDRLVPVSVKVETTFDEATRTVQIKGIGQTSIATQANALRFSCALVEDGVTGTSNTVNQLLDYDQTNYYAGGGNGIMGGFESLPDPVPASELVYNFVARAILGGFFGAENSVPDQLAAGDYFEFTFTYQVPAAFDVTKMKAIVFISDEETGEILNGNDAVLTGTVSVPLVPVGKSALYPNPATDFMNLSVDFQTTDRVTMNIFDTNGRLIRNLGELSLSNGKALEQISVAELNAGMYILELRHKKAVTALPFTKL
jgi:hypothetical protein